MLVLDQSIADGKKGMKVKMEDAASTQSRRATLISYYLPQFHPIPENDAWWGPGFTEWTNVAKARPLFRGHYQPHVPADLGFYDLRVNETRCQQAAMAREYGIGAFSYYHYWFNGRMLLQRPLEEVIQLGEPDFPFCVCWANESWKGKWHGGPATTLIEQTYGGAADTEAHFRYLAKAFSDRRYLRVDGKPMFVIYKPKDLSRDVTDSWRELAVREGLGGLYLVAVVEFADMAWDPKQHGYDAIAPLTIDRCGLSEQSPKRLWAKQAIRRLLGRPDQIYAYREVVRHFLVPEGTRREVLPCAIPNWDNTPRAGRLGRVLLDSSPALFKEHLEAVVRQVEGKEPGHRIAFIKSWNEWAEGNYLEPDLKFGNQYLEAVRDVVFR